MNRERLRQLAVAGTVTFPATFPRLAQIRLRRDRNLPIAGGPTTETFLVAIERPSARVTMRRVLRVDDVRAVFIPRDPGCVNLQDGTWLLGPEIEVGIQMHSASRRCVLGIVYVAEHTPTLLDVQAGMTAAESAQYYPPLPCDRSVNHYDPYRDVRSGAGGVRHGYCESYVCEPDHEFVPLMYCDPDGDARQSYQSSLDFEPAPFPSEDEPS